MIKAEMDSFSMCKSCESQQEALLEAGDGSQVQCECYDGLDEDEITEIIQKEKDSIGESSSNMEKSISFDVTPKTEMIIQNMAPMKRKNKTLSRLTEDENQPVIKKRLFESSFPSDEEFEEIRRHGSIIKWRNIPLNIIFQVINLEKVGKEAKEFNCITLRSKEGNVIKSWISSRILQQLQMQYCEGKSFFIKSFGVKACKSSSRNYFDFTIIVK